MARAIICDRCGDVVRQPGPAFSIDYHDRDADDWRTAEVCVECFPSDLEALLNTETEA